MKDIVNVIGGGLAGVEAAWQAAEHGSQVRLFEMRPVTQTPAHRTEKLAEIVCSNSLKSDEPGSAPYLLKEELRRGRSLVMEAAEATKIPAGRPWQSTAENLLSSLPSRSKPSEHRAGPRRSKRNTRPTVYGSSRQARLTSEALTASIMRFTGDDQLYFYDAIAPIVAADFDRYVDRIQSGSLWQRRRRLHQLPDEPRRVCTRFMTS